MKIKYFIAIIFILLIRNTGVMSQWIHSANLDSHTILEIAVKDNFIFAGTETSGVFRSSNNGTNWVSINSGIGNSYVSSFAVIGSGIFASTGDGVFHSSNYGSNWTSASGELPGGVIKKLVTRNNFVYAGFGLAGVFKTTNDGNNWTRFALGEGDKLFTMYATSSEFYISIANTILRTTDDGMSFNSAISGLTNLWVNSLSSYQEDLYAATRGGIFHSTDIGNNWTRVSNGLTDTVFNVIVNKGKNVFAGSQSKGVFFSNNKGTTWSSISSGLIDTNISTLAITSDFIFAGTVNGNIWRRPLSEILIGINLNHISLPEFELTGNFPNPFNPSTKILFSVNKNYFRTADLKIYNSAGMKFVDENLKLEGRGNYEFVWNAKDLPSGVYFYTVEIEDKILRSKTVLLK